MPRLRRYLIGLDVVGCVHEITGRRVNIGRTRDNDLRIVDPTVSRLHAMLTVRNGEAMVVDANSRNGIFVNGIQVRYARLDDGDLVTFGTVRFRYRVGSDSTGPRGRLRLTGRRPLQRDPSDRPEREQRDQAEHQQHDRERHRRVAGERRHDLRRSRGGHQLQEPE